MIDARFEDIPWGDCTRPVVEIATETGEEFTVSPTVHEIASVLMLCANKGLQIKSVSPQPPQGEWELIQAIAAA
jgi:hypothetical protein